MLFCVSGTAGVKEKEIPAAGLGSDTLRSAGLVQRETVYGIVRRYRFCLANMESLKSQLRLPVSAVRVLDVGCGTGINIAVPLAEAGYEVVGVDNDSRSIERACSIAHNINNLHFECRSVQDWDCSHLFHAVICSEVLEHVGDVSVFLENVKRFLVPGGMLLVTVPNGYGYFEMERAVEWVLPWLNRYADRFQHAIVRSFASRVLRARHNEEWLPERYQMAWTTLARDSGHQHRFTTTRIFQLIEQSGFRIDAMVGRTFLAGNILSNLTRDWDAFLSWNVNVADRLPLWMCSGWMIAARKKVDPGCTVG